jgi:hypothetical protein
MSEAAYSLPRPLRISAAFRLLYRAVLSRAGLRPDLRVRQPAALA